MTTHTEVLSMTDTISEEVLWACEQVGACKDGFRWLRMGQTYENLRDAGYLCWMALNCPVTAVLEMLSKDRTAYVRWIVTRNPHTTATVLAQLRRDNDAAVRRGVAAHPNTPVDVLHLLSQDSYEFVRRGAAKNPNAPAELLNALNQTISLT